MVSHIPFCVNDVATISQKCYGETPNPIQPLASATNHVYLLKFRNHPKKVIKIFKRKDQGVQRELNTYNFLAKMNVPAPQIEHFDITESTISRSWLTMNALGPSLHKLYWNRFYHHLGQAVLRRLFRKAGEAFAHIHNIRPDQGMAGKIGPDVGDFRADLENIFLKCVDQLIKKDRLQLSDIPRIERLFSQAQDSNEVGLCHLDFSPKQLLVDKLNLAGVIDWESSRFYNPVYDFAKCELKMKLHYNLFEAFRQGYVQVRSLPDDYDEIKKPYQLVVVLVMLKSLPEESEQYRTYQGLLENLLTQH